jgi:hypothetical protein
MFNASFMDRQYNKIGNVRKRNTVVRSHNHLCSGDATTVSVCF